MALGQGAKVAHSPDDITYTDIANIMDVGTFNYKTINDVEDSTFDDAADCFVAGSYTQALAFDIKYVLAATGLSAIWDSLDNGTVLYWRVRPVTGSGERQHVFQGYVTDISRPFSRNGVQVISVTVRPTGATTTSTQ